MENSSSNKSLTFSETIYGITRLIVESITNVFNILFTIVAVLMWCHGFALSSGGESLACFTIIWAWYLAWIDIYPIVSSFFFSCVVPT